MPSSVPLGAIHLIADWNVLAGHRDGEGRVRELLEAGLPSLTLRGPERSADELVAFGAGLRAEARRHGALFLVNGPRAAVERLDADGWHLPAAAPAPIDFDRPWGRSVHNEREIAEATGASWLFLSPVFPTASKPGAAGLGLERLAEWIAATPLPVYALGGVSAANAAACRDAGAHGVAAIRGLLDPGGREWIRRTMTAQPG